jgi:uncharacterized protein YkwD
LRRSSFLFLLAVSFACGAQTQDPYYALINEYRASEQACQGVARAPLPPLVAREALEKAAAEVAAGRDAAQSLRQSSYRMQRIVTLGISAPNSTAVGATLRRDFCRELGDPAFTEIGLHRDKGRVFFVLAVASPLPDAAQWHAAGLAVLELVNAARREARKCGEAAFEPAPPLRWNDRLAAAAMAHSEDMAKRDYFSHDSPEGMGYAQRVRRAGYAYRASGENIAAGQRTPQAAVAAWIASPPHCQNLMRREFTEMGAGYAVRGDSSQGIYWTQVFGTPLKP